MSNTMSGYPIPTLESNVFSIPGSETALAPFNHRQLDALARKIKPSDQALLLNPLRMIFLVFNTRTFRARAIRTIESCLYALLKTVEYLNGIESLEARITDKSILTTDLRSWLIGQGIAEEGIVQVQNRVIQWIRIGCSLPNTEHLKDDLVLEIRRKKQKFIKHKDTPTLQLIYPNSGIDAADDELLIGCKQCMVWLLNEYNNIRVGVTENLPELLTNHYHYLRQNKKTSISNALSHFAIMVPNQNVSNRLFATEELALVNTILNLNNDVANEVMFYEMVGFNKFSEECLDNNYFFSPDDIVDYFVNLKTNNTFRNNPTPNEYLKTAYRNPTNRLHGDNVCSTFFPSLSFPVYPTVDETMAMEWLLAADRLQLTAIQELNIKDNVLLDEQKKTIQFVEIVKNRASGAFKTDIYRNDNLYKTHYRWIKLLEKADSYIQNSDGKYILEGPRSSRARKSQKGFHKLRMSFWLMCVEGTLTNNRIKDDFRGTSVESAVNSFLKLLRHHMTDVKDVQERVAAIRRDEKTQNTHRRKKGDIGEMGICVKVIAQTRAVIDDNVMSGRLVGHTKETHENTYRNRTRSSLVNGNSASWAADVGSAMLIEAKRLADNSELVSVEEIKKTLNIMASTDAGDVQEIKEIIDEAERNGFVADLTTELKKNGRTIILETPWTAALMKAQIQHIDREIRRIEYNSPEKRRAAGARKMYLGLMLERFSEKCLLEAEKILDKYELPFPRMV